VQTAIRALIARFGAFGVSDCAIDIRFVSLIGCSGGGTRPLDSNQQGALKMDKRPLLTAVALAAVVLMGCGKKEETPAAAAPRP
jgi:hypothetical protein